MLARSKSSGMAEHICGHDDDIGGYGAAEVAGPGGAGDLTGSTTKL